MRAAAHRRAARLRADLLPVLQTALAAALAYGVASLVHENPFFAGVSAVIALGVGRGQRTRRAIELTAGVTLGIVVADGIVAVLGTSAPVVGVVVALSMLAAILIGAGDLLVAQAAVSAVIVATIEQPDGFEPDRAIDAGIGGLVALLVGQVLFRQRPGRALARAAVPLAEVLTVVLRTSAEALRTGDPATAARALDLARDTDGPLAAFEDAVLRARETLGGRARVPRYARAATQLGFATRNVRVLARRTVATTRKGTPPAGIAEAVDRLADATGALAAELEGGPPGRAREGAADAAALANAVLEQPGRGLQTTVLVGQVRSTAVDLLRAAGVDEDEAVALVDGA